jgi:hypothetical protein
VSADLRLEPEVLLQVVALLSALGVVLFEVHVLGGPELLDSRELGFVIPLLLHGRQTQLVAGPLSLPA